MEEELRLKRLESSVYNLHESRKKDRQDIDMLQEILKENQKTNELISEVVSYAKKTYEVFEPLAKIMSKVAKIGLLFTFLWHALKIIAAKAGFLT